ncbi:hypothetical protein CR513_45750, partial [Mucuna pruriens]
MFGDEHLLLFLGSQLCEQKSNTLKSARVLSVVSALAVSIFGGNVKTSKSAAPAGGPVATMVAASKHFSSPHKVRFA